MFTNFIKKKDVKKKQCSLCDVKTTSHEEWKKHLLTEEHKENVKIEEQVWKQLYEDMHFVS